MRAAISVGDGGTSSNEMGVLATYGAYTAAIPAASSSVAARSMKPDMVLNLESSEPCIKTIDRMYSIDVIDGHLAVARVSARRARGHLQPRGAHPEHRAARAQCPHPGARKRAWRR